MSKKRPTKKQVFAWLQSMDCEPDDAEDPMYWHKGDKETYTPDQETYTEKEIQGFCQELGIEPDFEKIKALPV